MTVAVGTRKLGMGSVVAVVGGALTLVGALLAWETIDAQIAALAASGTSQAGLEFNGGKIILVCGVIALIVAALDLAAMKVPVSVPWTIIVFGAIATLVGIANYFSVTKDVSDANSLLPNMAGVGIGLYVSILGAVAVLVGGILAKMMPKD
jgi:hypothetical protein